MINQKPTNEKQAKCQNQKEKNESKTIAWRASLFLFLVLFMKLFMLFFVIFSWVLLSRTQPPALESSAVFVKVECLQEPCPALQVAIKTTGGPADHETTTLLKPIQDGALYTSLAVRAGSYVAWIEEPAYFCWNQASIPFEVRPSESPVQVLVFSQTGYRLQTSSPAWMSGSVALGTQQGPTFTLRLGHAESLCLDQPSYSFFVPEGGPWIFDSWLEPSRLSVASPSSSCSSCSSSFSSYQVSSSDSSGSSQLQSLDLLSIENHDSLSQESPSVSLNERRIEWKAEEEMVLRLEPSHIQVIGEIEWFFDQPAASEGQPGERQEMFDCAQLSELFSLSLLRSIEPKVVEFEVSFLCRKESSSENKWLYTTWIPLAAQQPEYRVEVDSKQPQRYQVAQQGNVWWRLPQELASNKPLFAGHSFVYLKAVAPLTENQQDWSVFWFLVSLLCLFPPLWLTLLLVLGIPWQWRGTCMGAFYYLITANIPLAVLLVGHLAQASWQFPWFIAIYHLVYFAMAFTWARKSRCYEGQMDVSDRKRRLRSLLGLLANVVLSLCCHVLLADCSFLLVLASSALAFNIRRAWLLAASPSFGISFWSPFRPFLLFTRPKNE